MKTYFIDNVNGSNVAITATSVNDLEKKAMAFAENNIGGCRKIYVHCSHVCSKTTDEQNVEYLIYINNAKRTISTHRI